MPQGHPACTPTALKWSPRDQAALPETLPAKDINSFTDTPVSPSCLQQIGLALECEASVDLFADEAGKHSGGARMDSEKSSFILLERHRGSGSRAHQLDAVGSAAHFSCIGKRGGGCALVDRRQTVEEFRINLDFKSYSQQQIVQSLNILAGKGVALVLPHNAFRTITFIRSQKAPALFSKELQKSDDCRLFASALPVLS